MSLFPMVKILNSQPIHKLLQNSEQVKTWIAFTKCMVCGVHWYH